MISVVIPTRDRNDSLAKCLRRLAPGMQDLPADQYEVIVTDDGSKTPANEMVEQQFSWARSVIGPRVGPAANRNNGAKFGKGEWIVFTDDDCLPSKEWLASFVAAIVDEVDVYEGRTTCEAGITSPLLEAPINLTGGHLWSCNMMIRRSVFEQLRGFDESFPLPASEDIELHSRLTGIGKRILFVPAATVDHPPRRRKIGLAAAGLWESRVLLEAILGATRHEWLPLHVLKVRIAQLLVHKPSIAWVPYLLATTTELANVTVNYPRWKRKYQSRSKRGCG